MSQLLTASEDTFSLHIFFSRTPCSGNLTTSCTAKCPFSWPATHGNGGGEISFSKCLFSPLTPQLTTWLQRILIPLCLAICCGTKEIFRRIQSPVPILLLLSFTDHNLNTIKMTERKAVVKNADMPEDMQSDAIECATQAMEKFNIEKDIAAYIKKEFDKKYNPTWHCITGRNFGSYVTHETKHFVYFYLGQVAVLLFKSG